MRKKLQGWNFNCKASFGKTGAQTPHCPLDGLSLVLQLRALLQNSAPEQTADPVHIMSSQRGSKHIQQAEFLPCRDKKHDDNLVYKQELTLH